MTLGIYKGRCFHCGSNLIVLGEDGPYCLLCRRPWEYRRYAGRLGGLVSSARHPRNMVEVGRLGGLSTAIKYGSDYMGEIGRRGGLRVNG